MPSSQVDQLEGLTTSVAVKAPVRVSTTTNLSVLSGLLTIDGVTVSASDRVLVKNQTTASQNGIYNASAATWARAPDFDGTRDVVDGTQVYVRQGLTNSATYWQASISDSVVTIGTSNITFIAAMFGASSTLGFLQSGTGTVARTVQAKLRDAAVSVKDFGAVGDNSVDDTAAVAAAVNYCQSLAYTPSLYLGGGFYKITTLPQLTKPITIFGDNPRSSALMLSGAVDVIKIKGSGTRATAIQFRSLTLNGNAMTAGYAVNVDWAQDVLFDNVIFNNPWNGLYARQVGNLQFRNCLIATVRGAVGVDLFGNNTTRNGENDQIDLAIFDSVIIQSDLPSVGGTNSSIMLRVDGYVHTIHMDGLRLLSGGKGLQALNTPALAANLVPRFFIGSSLECENHYQECIDLQAALEFSPSFLFAVGSHTADGVKLSSNVGIFAPTRCNFSTNYFNGLNTNGANYVHLSKPLIYNNSIVGAGLKDGVYLSGSGIASIEGGLIGKNTSIPAYTELQRYGVEMDPAFNGILIMSSVDLRSNQTAALYDNAVTAVGTTITGCAGYNPRGTGTQATSASPWTVVAGPTQESWMLVGTVISVTIGGVTLTAIAATGGTFVLNPRQSAVITYTTLTSVVVTKA